MAIQRTLLERIRNPDPAGERHLRVSSNEIFDSILVNLQNLLNTCAGNCLTDELYGLPHMSAVRGAIPQSISGFATAIRRTIQRHEPRLANVRVRHAPAADHAMGLRFEIHGVIVDEGERTSVRFETVVDDEGRMRVR